MIWQIKIKASANRILYKGRRTIVGTNAQRLRDKKIRLRNIDFI